MSRSFQIVNRVEFPTPQGLNVNMMPFILGDASTLPSEMRQYLPVIEACQVEESLLGEVCYLTITENEARAGNSHRRGGVHVEAQPQASWGIGGWGKGSFASRRQDGLYIASNVSNTTRLWDALDEDMGEGGSLEHKEHLYPVEEGIALKAGEVCWLTDRTPHESVPVRESVFRQFFRLVTPKISVWFKDKSTPSPFGVAPQCPVV